MCSTSSATPGATSPASCGDAATTSTRSRLQSPTSWRIVRTTRRRSGKKRRQSSSLRRRRSRRRRRSGSSRSGWIRKRRRPGSTPRSGLPERRRSRVVGISRRAAEARKKVPPLCLRTRRSSSLARSRAWATRARRRRPEETGRSGGTTRAKTSIGRSANRSGMMGGKLGPGTAAAPGTTPNGRTREAQALPGVARIDGGRTIGVSLMRTTTAFRRRAEARRRRSSRRPRQRASRKSPSRLRCGTCRMSTPPTTAGSTSGPSATSVRTSSERAMPGESLRCQSRRCLRRIRSQGFRRHRRRRPPPRASPGSRCSSAAP
mmetsp:Transcript_66047/g.190592  ORF Transcript_66047/g.190592 Transcript_66047/m.190592 type:complete len:318 (-) Transcript_66047:1248-2201(-)